MDGPRVSVRIDPSLRLLHLLLALHAGAVVSVMCSSLSPAWKSLLALLALASGIRELSRHLIATRGEEILLGFDGQRWTIEERGIVTPVELLPDSRVLPYAVVVRLRGVADRRVRSLLLLPDSAGADEMRRLRACLRLRKGLAPRREPSRPHPL